MNDKQKKALEGYNHFISLRSHNLELGTIDDIAKLLNISTNYIGEAGRVTENINKLSNIINSVVDDIDNMQTQLSNVDGKLANLGGFVQDSLKAISMLEQKTKELGIDYKSIKGVTELLKAIDESKKFTDKLKQAQKVGVEVLKKIK